MTDDQIHAVVARPDPASGMVKVILVINNQTREFLIAKHVAAMVISALSDALAKG